MENLWLILIGLIAYLLGSIPTAYLITGKKVLEEGSGNVGAMNTYRVTGSLGPLIFCLLADGLKGVLALLLVRYWLIFLGYHLGFGVMIASFFVVLGHNYSLILKFLEGKFYGGRGLASLIGVLLVLNWLSVFVCLGVVLVAIFLTELLMKRKLELNWQRLLSVTGSQVLGRYIGIVICLIPLYFLMPRELFPAFPLLSILPAALLSFWKHIERLRGYLEGVKTNQ
jgi:acyl-phosphate glycerol 3-phosphate acyltransferase